MNRIMLFVLVAFVAIWIMFSVALPEHDNETAQATCSAGHWDTVTIGDTVYNCKEKHK